MGKNIDATMDNDTWREECKGKQCAKGRSEFDFERLNNQ